VADNSCDGVKLWAGGRIENTLVYGMGDGIGGPSPWAGIVLGGEPGARFEVVNVTVHDDPARRAYPVYMQYDEPAPMSVLLRNTVIADGHGEVYLGDAVTARIEHCDLYRPDAVVQVHANGRDYTAAELRAGALGAGNFSAAPRFVAPGRDTNDGFRPLDGSPLIDAGTADGAPTVDLAGGTRPAGDGVDIGAYEHAASRGPRLWSVIPRRSRPGQWVVLRGAGFGRRRQVAAAPQSRRTASVFFGSRRAAVYATWRDGRIRVEVPPRPAGRVRLSVRTADGRSNTIRFLIVPARPTPR
jgi:hypothetical protein